jgi:methylated-DNA-[protein]-cysteine S-methyltransferase
MNQPTYHTRFDTRLGPLLLTSDGTTLTGLYMNHLEVADGWVLNDDAAPFAEARRQLAAYFDGTTTTFDFDRLPLATAGTNFQRRVWDALREVPYGVTISYGELARRIGDPKASRAVGLANGRNPLSILVPCHRVIGAKGTLIGYGGGLSRKRVLLAWEASVATGRARWPADEGAVDTPRLDL